MNSKLRLVEVGMSNVWDRPLHLNKTDWIIIGVGIVAVVILLVFYVMDEPKRTHNTEFEKLQRGEISVFQYCSHIGKAAVDDENCKEFNLLYGPNN